MTEALQLARFVTDASYARMSSLAREQMKIRILDSLGCAIGALGEPPVANIRACMHDMGEGGPCTLIGSSRSAAPDRAAFYNAALVRYLDFNDSYMSSGDYAHPSDNFGAVLAAAEFNNCSGAEFIAALAVAYQVQTRLVDVAPVLSKGFDHTVQGSYAVAAGTSKALKLDDKQTANAIAISGTAFNALRVTRTGNLSNWKGLAYANTGFGCTHAAFLARSGITGPEEVFEGNKGFKHTIAGNFSIDWSKEDLESVVRTSIKKYNATIDAQTSTDAALRIHGMPGFDASRVQQVEIDIFDVAFQVIGGGEEGDKLTVRTKEEADHSLLYVVAVALLDGQVMPDQYKLERILREDVQGLLRRVRVRSNLEFTRNFPEKASSHIRVTTDGGKTFESQSDDYEGYRSRPMSWETARGKFDKLTGPATSRGGADEIANAVEKIDTLTVREFTAVLRKNIQPVD